MTIYLIDGKPHRLCDCDEHTELCPRGGKRTLQTCGFSRCFVPAPDAVYAAPSAAPDAALPGLELAAGIVESLPIIGQEFDGRLGVSGAVNVSRRYLTAAIRAEIARRTK